MSCCQSFSRKRPVNLVSPAPLPVSHVHNSGAKLQLQKPLKYSFVKVQISSFEVFISRHDVYRQRWGFLVNCKSFLNLLLLHISVFGTFAGTSRMKPRHSTWWGLQAAYQLRQCVQTQENQLGWETAIDKTSKFIHRGMLRMEQQHRGFSFHHQWPCGAHEPVFGWLEGDRHVCYTEDRDLLRCSWILCNVQQNFLY